MDILKLTSDWTRKIVSKLIANALSKKFGIETDIDLVNVQIKNDGDTTSLIFEGKATLATEDVKNLVGRVLPF